MKMKPALLLLLAVAALLAALPLFAADEDLLFFDLSQAQASTDPSVSRAKTIAINWKALQGTRGAAIKINLFDDQVLPARRDRIDPSSAVHGYVWVGHVEGFPEKAVTLSVANGIMVGAIFGDGREQYRITWNGQHQILQKRDNSQTFEIEGPDIVKVQPGSGSGEPATSPSNPGCEDGSRIDLLVAYTPAAAQRQGGQSAMEALINQRVADMNSANINSGLPFRFHLLQSMPVGYGESGDVRLDLARLRDPADGFLDAVHQARDVQQADLVSLLVGQAGTGLTCGVGYLMEDLSTANAGSAFNVAALDYAGDQYTCSSYTMAHELGHNMGNRHERTVASGEAILPYAYGYQSPNETFRTIMAYNCEGGCPRINHWSNPQVSYAGEATGRDHDQDPDNSADNAHSMMETAHYVANFRSSCPAEATPTPGPTATTGPIDPTPTPNPTAQALPPGPFSAFVPLTRK